MAKVSINTASMNNFEATASYLLPYFPVSKKRIAIMKRGATNISDTTEAVIYIADGKVSTEKTSV